jgi:hypothetical protein
MDEIDLKLLALVQDGFPLTPRPFRDLGEALGLDEKEVIERLMGLQKGGLVSMEEADDVAKVVNQYQEVSHNYLRPNASGYNLWFTVSASDERIQEILQEIKTLTGRAMLVMPTGRIFKIGVKFDII